MSDPVIRGWRLLISRLGSWLVRIAGDGPHAVSMVECRVCGYRHMVVIPADSDHVRVIVEDVECNNCGAMTCDTVESIPE